MPFSLLMCGYPTADAPMAAMQGPAVQGMFLHLIEMVDVDVNRRLHNDDKYRPYTVSPLGLGDPGQHLYGNWLAREARVARGTPCYVRLTLLEDALFPTFARYFLEHVNPTFRLGDTEFVVTDVMGENHARTLWNQYVTYAELIQRASAQQRKITLNFLTPTSFRRGNVDFPLPDPRLVFGSYHKRLSDFEPVTFLPDFEAQVEYYTGIAHLDKLRTDLVQTKKIPLVGFTGRVTYEIDRRAPAELILQMNLLADYAFFCGTGRKTAVGMGQTVRLAHER